MSGTRAVSVTAAGVGLSRLVIAVPFLLRDVTLQAPSRTVILGRGCGQPAPMAVRPHVWSGTLLHTVLF